MHTLSLNMRLEIRSTPPKPGVVVAAAACFFFFGHFFLLFMFFLRGTAGFFSFSISSGFFYSPPF